MSTEHRRHLYVGVCFPPVVTGASYETEGTLGVVWCGVDNTLDKHSVEGLSLKRWHLWLMNERNSEICLR